MMDPRLPRSCASIPVPLAATGGSGSERDPAWLTVAAGAVAVPLFDLLFIAPTTAVIDNPAMLEQSLPQRESWLLSWGRRKYVEVALSVTCFAAVLLLVGTEKEEGLHVRGPKP